MFVCICVDLVCHFVFAPTFLCSLGGQPSRHIPLNGILWFSDLSLYNQFFTPFIPDFLWMQLCHKNYLVNFLFKLVAAVNYLG